MSYDQPLFRTEFRARVEPKQREDLKQSAVPLIGRELTFRREWIIGADESERYAGQWACQLTTRSEEELRADGTLQTLDWIWMPEEDLEVLEELGANMRTIA